MLCGGIWFWLGLTWTLWVPSDQMQVNFMKASIIGVWLWHFLEPWDSNLEWLTDIFVAKNFKAACWHDQTSPTKRTLVSEEERLTLIESSKLIEDTLVAEKKKMSEKVLEEALLLGRERTVRKASDNSEEKGPFKSLRKKVSFFPFSLKIVGSSWQHQICLGTRARKLGDSQVILKCRLFNKVEEV